MEGNRSNTSLCRICAENGHPEVTIFWAHEGERDDGTPRWIPYKDQACTVRHVHKHLETKAVEEATAHDATAESNTVSRCRTDSIKEQPEYLSDSETKDTLTTAYELSQRQSRLLKNLIDNLDYLPEENS